MNSMPKYVLKEKKLSKTKTVIVFKRNFMNITDFVEQNGMWIYEESFVHRNVKCNFKLIIHSQDIYDMFGVNSTSMRIRGPRNSFGVFVRLPKQKLPIKAHNKIGCAEYYLLCIGQKLPYDNGKETNNRKYKEPSVKMINSTTKTHIEIPNSVSWSLAHPFQGGGCTPK